MITQDNRNGVPKDTDEKIRLLKELLNDDADARTSEENSKDGDKTAQTVTVSGNGNIVSTGNSKVIFVNARKKSEVLKTCLLCCLFF